MRTWRGWAIIAIFMFAGPLVGAVFFALMILLIGITSNTGGITLSGSLSPGTLFNTAITGYLFGSIPALMTGVAMVNRSTVNGSWIGRGASFGFLISASLALVAWLALFTTQTPDAGVVHFVIGALGMALIYGFAGGVMGAVCGLLTRGFRSRV